MKTPIHIDEYDCQERAADVIIWVVTLLKMQRAVFLYLFKIKRMCLDFFIFIHVLLFKTAFNLYWSASSEPRMSKQIENS